VDRFQQLFLLAAQHGKKTIAEQTAFVWECLSTQDQRIVKEGKALETADEHIAELTRQANAFGEKRRPMLKALGID
jgi:hypothetical protein